MVGDGLSIPRAQQSNSRHGCNLCLFFDFRLQNKALLFVSFLFIKHKSVFGQSCVDKVVDIDAVESGILDVASFVVLF
jgi:hypothetical protein